MCNNLLVLYVNLKINLKPLRFKLPQSVYFSIHPQGNKLAIAP